MKLNRRSFIQSVGTATLFLFSVGPISLLSGCNVFSDILNWVPVGLTAFQSIITLLEGAGVINVTAGGAIAATIGIIETGFADLKLAIQQYQAITPPPAGALAKIDAILALIVSDFQNLLSSLNITDSSLEKLVVGLAEIILSTIAGFQALLPASAAAAGRAFTIGTQYMTIAPHHRTRRGFIKDWNSEATAGGHPELNLPLSLMQHL